jgi:hypothetical protein
MTKKLSLSVKKMLLNKIKDKYKKAKKKDKSFIIDDVVELTNYKRKYDIHQLNTIKNTYRERQRPTEAKPTRKTKSFSVVEDALESYQGRFKLEDK